MEAQNENLSLADIEFQYCKEGDYRFRPSLEPQGNICIIHFLYCNELCHVNYYLSTRNAKLAAHVKSRSTLRVNF